MLRHAGPAPGATPEQPCMRGKASGQGEGYLSPSWPVSGSSAAMSRLIWPADSSTCSLLHTLGRERKGGKGGRWGAEDEGRAAAPVHSAATRAGAGARRPMPHRVRERLRCVLLLHGGSEAARQAQAGGSSAAAEGKEGGHGSQGFSSTASCPWACQGAQSRLSHAAARLCCYNLSDSVAGSFSVSRSLSVGLSWCRDGNKAQGRAIHGHGAAGMGGMSGHRRWRTAPASAAPPSCLSTYLFQCSAGSGRTREWFADCSSGSAVA